MLMIRALAAQIGCVDRPHLQGLTDATPARTATVRRQAEDSIEEGRPALLRLRQEKKAHCFRAAVVRAGVSTP
jgi:hypothetical protein